MDTLTSTGGGGPEPISDEDAERLTTVGETQAYLQDKGVL